MQLSFKHGILINYKTIRYNFKILYYIIQIKIEKSKNILLLHRVNIKTN